MTWRLCVVLLLLASARAVPVSISEDSRCVTACSVADNFQYAPGTTYQYDYSVMTTTLMQGASEDSAILKIQARAEIAVLRPCDFVLQLHDVSLRHSDSRRQMKTADKEKEFSQTLQKNVLRFSFNDGIVDHICPDTDDAVWVLNIKRGVLSSFQNGMSDWNKDENKTETDIAGDCMTHYQIESAGYYTSYLKKTKDILSCTRRQAYQGFHHVVPYNADSDIQNVPITKTTHECRHTVATKGLLQKSECTETHVFRPFSNGQSGGSTIVTQSLTFTGEKEGISVRPKPGTERSPLVFDYEDMEKANQDKTMAKVMSAITGLCQTTQLEIRPETPQMFETLIRTLRPLDSRSLTKLYQDLKSSAICPENPRVKKFFIDALPFIKSPAAIQLMATMIVNEEVNAVEARIWLTSLTFLKSPTSEMLRDMQVLIDNDKTRDMAILPVSSMVHNFCHKMKPGMTCDENADVISIISSIEKGIDRYCDTRQGKLDKTLLTLRALGNAGHMTRPLSTITKCLKSRFSSLEAKVAAAEAFRRMPCNADDQDLWRTLKDTNSDSELRVTAYLSLMRCPTEPILNKIATILNKEDNGQVGNFIYSHITNLMETSDPHKQDVARAIKRLTLEDKFDLDPLKHSRNIEISTLLNKINTGFTSDSNIIWSDKPQLPRSVSTNFTVELFGHSINLLEFGGRVEGLDSLLRSFFSASKGELNLSVFGRMFGNEILYSQSSFDLEKMPEFQTPSEVMNFLIKMSKNHKYELTHSMQIFESTFVLPSVGGLPIHLHLNGSTTLDLQVSGKMDLRKVASKPRSLDVDGEISPSAAIEITGTMGVHAFETHTGLRMRNAMHTSTSLKGQIRLERGQKFHFEIEAPKEKMEIFEASSKFYILHDNVEKEQEMIKDNRKEFQGCTGDKMSKAIGLELCGQMSFPNASMHMDSPYFPITGPIKAKVTLMKKDTHTSYKLFVQRVENKKSSVAQISFNTPRSKVSRSMLMDITLNYPNKELEITLATPWKKAAMKGSIINDKGMKSLVGNLEIDEKMTYALTSEVKISESKNKANLSPMIVLRRPGQEDIQLTGTVEAARYLKSVKANLSLSGLQKIPYTFKGEMYNSNGKHGMDVSFSQDSKRFYVVKAINEMSMKKAKRLNSNLEIKTPERRIVYLNGDFSYVRDKSLKMAAMAEIHKLLKRSSISGIIQKSAKKNAIKYNSDIKLKSSKVSGRLTSASTIKGTSFLASKMTLDYVIPRWARDKITMSTKLNDRSTKAYNKYNIRSNVGFKKNPDYNVGMTVALDYKKRLAAADIELKYGRDPKDKTKRIHVNGIIKKKVKNLKNAQLNYKMQAEAPQQDINWVLTGKHQHTPRMVNSIAKMSYANGKQVNMDINWRDQSSKLKKMNGKMTVGWPGKEYSMVSSINQKNGKQYQHSFSLKDNKGMKHDVSTTLTMSKAGKHSINSKINLSGMKPLTFSGSSNLDPKNFVVTGEAKQGTDVYGMTANGKYVPRSPRGEIDVEIYYPSQKLGLLVAAGAGDGKYQGKMETTWSVKKNKMEKASVEGYYLKKDRRDTMSYATMFQIKTPFEPAKDIGAMIKFGSDVTKHDLSAKLSWGGKAKTVSTLMTLNRPVSWTNFQATTLTKTPLNGFRQIQLDVAHKINPSLAMTINGLLEDNHAKLSVSGENNGDSNRRDLKGQISLATNLERIDPFSLTISHTDDSRKFKTSSVLQHKNDKYTYDMDMNHYRSGWRVENDGTIIVSSPKLKSSTTWNHKSSDSNVKSSLLSKWNNKKLSVSITGDHRTGSLRTIESKMSIQSPWAGFENMMIKIDHKQGDGLIDSKSTWMEGRRRKGMAELNFKQIRRSINFDMMLSSPYHEDVTSKMDVNYERYPMTVAADVSWNPRSKATLTASASTIAWNNINVDMKVTSPMQHYENIVLKATSKERKQENIFNVVIDTGVRETFDIEGRFRNDRTKLCRLKVTTPHPEFSSLDTGMSFDGDITDFDARADFELKPHVDKIRGLVVMKYKDDVNGNLHFESPFEIMPFMDILVSSRKDGDLRMSTLDLKYAPQQSYTLDTSYKFQFPITFDCKLTSSNQDLNGLSLSIHHDHSENNVESRAAVTYRPGKEIETDINVKWSREIEGMVIVKTPFPDFEDNKISFRHKGNRRSFEARGEYKISDHTALMDASMRMGTLTTGSVTVKTSIPGAEEIEATFRKRGPIHNMKGNGMVKVNSKKISGNFLNKATTGSLKTEMSFSSPFTEQITMSLDMQGTMESFNIKTKSGYGRKNSMESIVSFDKNDEDINGNGMFKYRIGRKRETLRAVLTKSGNWNNLQVGFTGTRNRATVIFNGSLKRNWKTDLLLELKTPLKGYTDLGLTMNHVGNLKKFVTSSTLKYMDGKTIDGSIDFSFGNGKTIQLTSEINSGIEGFEATTLKINNNFEHTTMDIDGSVELRTTAMKFGQGQLTYKKTGNLNDFVIEGKASRNGREKASILVTGINGNKNHKGELILKSPFNEDLVVMFENVGDMRSLMSTMTFKHGTRNIITGKMSMRQTRAETKANGEMTYMIHAIGSKALSFDMTAEGNMNDMSIIANGKVDNSLYVMNSKFKNMDDIIASVVLKTPIYGYTDLGMSFKHSGVLDRFNSEAMIKFSDADEFSGKIDFYRYLFRRIETTLEIKTPFNSYEFTKFEYRHESETDNFMCLSTLEYGNSQKIVYEMSAKFTPKPEYKVSLQTPYKNYNNLLALVSYGIDGDTYDMKSNLNIGNGNAFSVKGNLQATNQPMGYIQITSPFDGFNDLSANFQLKGTNRTFETIAEVTYMDGKKINGKATIFEYWPYRMESSAEISTPFSGWENTKINIKHNDNRQKMTSSFDAEYGRGKKIDGSMVIVYKPNYSVSIDLNTPFNDVRTVNGKGSIKMTRMSYEADYSVTINNYKKYSGDGKWKSNTWMDVDGSVSMTDPHFGSNEAQYTHFLSRQGARGQTVMKRGTDDTFSVIWTSALEPTLEATVTVKTPIYGYEDMQGSLMYKDENNVYDTMTKIDLGRGKVYEFEAGLDSSTVPMTIFSRITTPLEHFPKAEFRVNQEGSVNDFKSSFYMFTPATDTVDASASLKYLSIFNVLADAKLKSAMEYMDDIHLQMENTEISDEKRTKGVMQWTSGQVISYEVSFRSQESWREDNYHTDVTLATPFEALRSWSMILDQKIKQKSYDEKFIIEMNGEQVIDMDTLVDIENDPRMEIIVRQPWPMQFLGKTSSQEGDHKGQFYMNWDRDDPVSNINVNFGLQNQPDVQGFNVDLVHPSRSVGVAHKMTTKSKMNTMLEGKLFWDTGDDNQLGYSLELKDTSQRRRQIREATLDVGLPGRAFGLTSSYVVYGQTHSVDGSFSWDTRRDISKKIGVKANIFGTSPRKGELVISLPSFNKELKVDGEMMMDNGRILLDAKTDFSYSQDSRKTVTLVSKLEDITDYYSIYNYSLSLGMTHPYTKTDILVTSHLGQSTEKMTMGMDTRYLTARRQNKNMALFAEINNLKNQLHFQVSNPSHKMEILGLVESQSPYKLHMESKMDDVDIMQSDLTIDMDKKAVLLDTRYNDNQRLSVSAMYPNSTALNIEAIRRSGAYKEKELLIGLRLNTSQLLHTAIKWRPGAWEELRQFVLSNAEMKGETAIQVWRDTSNDVLEEISSKYTSIAYAIAEEITPVLQDIREEFNDLHSQLQKFVTSMDTLYYSDDDVWKLLDQWGKSSLLSLRYRVSDLIDRWYMLYKDWFQFALQELDNWKRHPMRAIYMNKLDQMELSMRENMRQIIDSARQIDWNLDEMFKNMADRRKNMIDQLYDNEYMRQLDNRISQIQRMDWGSYMDDVTLPPAYQERITEINDMIISMVDSQMHRAPVRYLHGGLNEVYQQARWAYHYWDVEKNVPRQIRNGVNFVTNIVADEIKEQVQPIQTLAQNPITVWMPESGYVQLCLPLPLPVDRLDELPDWSPYAKKVEVFLEGMIPDTRALVAVYENASSYFSSAQASDTLRPDENKRVPQPRRPQPPINYKSVRKYRPRNRGYRNRRTRN